jgi:hypothetical protein
LDKFEPNDNYGSFNQKEKEHNYGYLNIYSELTYCEKIGYFPTKYCIWLVIFMGYLLTDVILTYFLYILNNF